jgi:hypothetical protein
MLTGDAVQARDGRYGWFDAVIVAERGEGEAREVKVHYKGFGTRYDKWVRARDKACIRGADEDPEEDPPDWGDAPGLVDAADSQFMVERIVRKKVALDGTVMYLCKFVGHAKGEYIPAEDVDSELVASFEEARAPGPAGPYVLSLPETIAPDVADALVTEWGEDIGRKSAALLARQREEFAARQLFSMSPCPPWLFRALQRYFLKRAAAAFGARRTRAAAAALALTCAIGCGRARSAQARMTPPTTSPTSPP